MDFFSVLNQRQLDQNSEVRKLHRTSLCYAVCAIGSLFIASLVAPSGTPPELRKADFWSVGSIIVFTCCSGMGYFLMVKALHVLNTNRFLPPPTHSAPRVTSTLLMPLPHDALSWRQRLVFVYGLLVCALGSVYFGLATTPFGLYVIMLILQLALFGTSWFTLKGLMNPSR